MSLEKVVLLLSWIITIVLLWLFIPKNKITIANTAFLFKQVITWVLGLSVVQLKLIEYPVRLFKNATSTSFTFEYFAYPAFCAIFVVNFPVNKNLLYRFLYYSFFSSVITIFEVILEKYTQLINYLHWSWYITWISLFVTFFLSRIYTTWFYKRFLYETKT